MRYIEKIKFLQQNSIIVADPERIDPINSQYNDIDQNRKMYAEQFKNRGKEILTVAQNVKLYLKSDQFKIFDDNEKLILYTMTFETHKIFGHTFAVQSFVWASPRLEAYKIENESVTAHVFFKYLMRTAGGVAIATDAFHTPDGERFWLRRVSQAFRMRQHIYLIDIAKNKKSKVTNYEDFQHKLKEMKIWEDKGKGGIERRVILSPKVLWS